MTELKRTIEKEEVYGYECDVCGNLCCNNEHQAYEWATLRGHWGYFSNKDQEDHECHMCESCYDKVREFIEGLGGRIRVRHYHILTGEILGE